MTSGEWAVCFVIITIQTAFLRAGTSDETLPPDTRRLFRRRPGLLRRRGRAAFGQAGCSRAAPAVHQTDAREAGARSVSVALPRQHGVGEVPGLRRSGAGLLLLLRVDGGGPVVRDGDRARQELRLRLVGAGPLPGALGPGRRDEGFAESVGAARPRQQARAVPHQGGDGGEGP